MLGYAAYFFTNKPWVQVLTLRKLDLSTVKVDDWSDTLDYVDRPAGFGIDAVQTTTSGNPLNILSDILDFRPEKDISLAQNGHLLYGGALININFSFVPNVL